MSLIPLVLYVELAALYHLRCLVVGVEPLMLTLYLIPLGGPPLRISISLPPQLPLNRVQLGVKLLVSGGSTLECVGDVRQGQCGDNGHVLVRSAHERSLAVLLALLGLAPHLRIGLEVFNQRWHIWKWFKHTLL